MKWDHMNSTIQISSAVRPHLLAEEFHPIPKTLQLFLIILGGGGLGGLPHVPVKISLTFL